MTGIIRLQLFRLRKSATFWVFLGLCIGLPLIGALIVLAAYYSLGGAEFGSIAEVMETSVTSSLINFSSCSSDTCIFAVICSSLLLSREFSQGTVRNTILANKSRLQVFLAYVATAMMIGAIYFLAEFASTLVCYGSIFGFGSLSAGQAISAVACCFAMGLGATLFSQSLVCVFLFGTRKQSATIAWPLVICLVGVSIVAAIIEYAVIWATLDGIVLSETLLKCLPFYNFSLLGETVPDGLACGMIILYDVVFSAAFLAIGFATLKKADLK